MRELATPAAQDVLEKMWDLARAAGEHAERLITASGEHSPFHSLEEVASTLQDLADQPDGGELSWYSVNQVLAQVIRMESVYFSQMLNEDGILWEKRAANLEAELNHQVPISLLTPIFYHNTDWTL